MCSHDKAPAKCSNIKQSTFPPSTKINCKQDCSAIDILAMHCIFPLNRKSTVFDTHFLFPHNKFSFYVQSKENIQSNIPTARFYCSTLKTICYTLTDSRFIFQFYYIYVFFFCHGHFSSWIWYANRSFVLSPYPLLQFHSFRVLSL